MTFDNPDEVLAALDGQPASPQAQGSASIYRAAWEALPGDSEDADISLVAAITDAPQRLDVVDAFHVRALSGGLVASLLALLAALVLTATHEGGWVTLPSLLALIPFLGWLLPALLGSLQGPRLLSPTTLLWLFLAPALVGSVITIPVSAWTLYLHKTHDWPWPSLADQMVRAASWPPALLVGMVVVVLGMVAQRRLGLRRPWLEPARPRMLSRVAAWICVLGWLAAVGWTVEDLRPRVAELSSPEVLAMKSDRTWQRYPFRVSSNLRGPTTDSLVELLQQCQAGQWSGYPKKLLEEILPHLRYQQYRELPPSLLMALAEEVDTQLGTLHRSSAHDFELESRILPFQLALWARVREQLSPGQIWSLRTTGTLLSLEFVLQNSAARPEDLRALLPLLQDLRLTEGELYGFLRREILEEMRFRELAPARDPEWAFGLIDSPQRLSAQVEVARRLQLVGPSPARPSEPLTMAAVTRRVSPFVPVENLVWESRDLPIIAGLPLRLNLALEGVKARLGLKLDNIDPDLSLRADLLGYGTIPGWLATAPLKLRLPKPERTRKDRP